MCVGGEAESIGQTTGWGQLSVNCPFLAWISLRVAGLPTAHTATSGEETQESDLIELSRSERYTMMERQ